MPAQILPDYLAPGLRAVFVGTAVGTTSAARGHYYAGPGNVFWDLLHRSGLTTNRLYPDDDRKILAYGFGLTDLVKTRAASSDAGLIGFDVPGFVAKMERYKPAWVVFHGKEPAKQAARHLRKGTWVPLGRQSWTIGATSVFVLPSSSAANQNPAVLEGKASRVEWWKELAHELTPLK
jgi:TDG/mug DNA glycosylase family protein